MLMIRPQRRFIMPRVTERMATNAPRRFASSTASQSSSLSRSRMLSRVRPALLTRMSTLPSSSSARSTSDDDRRRIGDVAREAARLRARSPRPPPSRAPRRGPRRRPARRTRRAISAIARPMPRVLPVTSADRPERSIFMRRALSSAETSAAVPHAIVLSAGAIRFTSPHSTLPGPISTYSASGNRAASARISSAQRTGLESCSSEQLLGSRRCGHGLAVHVRVHREVGISK